MTLLGRQEREDAPGGNEAGPRGPPASPFPTST
jgi:hypothetical protein